jgi:hypothetical protein
MCMYVRVRACVCVCLWHRIKVWYILTVYIMQATQQTNETEKYSMSGCFQILNRDDQIYPQDITEI